MSYVLCSPLKFIPEIKTGKSLNKRVGAKKKKKTVAVWGAAGYMLTDTSLAADQVTRGIT